MPAATATPNATEAAATPKRRGPKTKLGRELSLIGQIERRWDELALTGKRLVHERLSADLAELEKENRA
jgi:hypothetical protein